MRRLTIIACMLCIIVAGPANGQTLKRFEGQLYEKVRLELIRAGYKPLRLKLYDDLLCTGNFCRKYPEVFSCGSGIVICYFAFIRTRDHKYFVAATQGEIQHKFIDFGPADKYDVKDIRCRLGELDCNSIYLTPISPK